MTRLRRNQPGVCRWCGCSEFDPCPGSCGWANREQTLCTACVDVDREWKRVQSPKPNMRAAFFRGFMAGADDERATEYSPGRYAVDTQRYWHRGNAAGKRLAR